MSDEQLIRGKWPKVFLFFCRYCLTKGNGKDIIRFMKTERLAFRTDKELRKQVEEKAKKENRTVSNLLNTIVRKAVKK